MRLSLELFGAGEIAAAVAENREEMVKASRLLVADYGAYMHDLTFQLSPYDALELNDTFHMRENIRIETDDDGLGVDVGWRHEDFTNEGFAPYYLFQEFGTLYMPAQPSLGPAASELEPLFYGDAADILFDNFL